MRQTTIDRALAVLITMAGIFTVHQVIKRYFIEDTQWIHSTPTWALVAGALPIATVIMWGIWAWLLRGTAIDRETREKIHNATGE